MGRETSLPTNLAIDDRLIEEARELGHHRTKKEAVNAALDDYVRRRKQMKILDLFGKIDYYDDYDYKRERMRKRRRRPRRRLFGRSACHHCLGLSRDHRERLGSPT